MYSPYQSTELLIISVQASLSAKKSEKSFFAATIMPLSGLGPKVKSEGSEINRLHSVLSCGSILPDIGMHPRVGNSSIYFSSGSEINLPNKVVTENEKQLSCPSMQSSESFQSIDFMLQPMDHRALALKTFRMKKFNSTSTLFLDRTLVDSDILEILQ
jgi:hypothetical protein